MKASDAERGLVWVVEDSPLEAEMIRRALSSAHDARVFGDGATMLEALAASPPPHVLLLDLVLPGLSGLEICRSVRERHSSTELPVLILTMRARTDTVFDAFALGVNDYLGKPVDVRELLARVTGLVRTARVYRANAERTNALEASSAVGIAVSSATSAQDVAQRSVDAIAAHLDTRGVAVAVERNGSFSVVASVGDSLAATLARSGQEVSRRDAHVIPLTVQGATVGRLGVVTDSAHAADCIAAPIANVLALGLARADLLERERSARSVAEGANRAKDEFLAIVSHELRTPLNAIVGWATLLRQGSLPAERVTSAVEKIERNALAQSQLIDDLLDISRIITGKMALKQVEIDVSAATRAALASMELAANKKGVALDVSFDDSARVTGDPSRIQQVVLNLLSNALRFTPAGGSVSVSVGKRADGIHIEVADTGAGIDPAFLPHIFDRFTQGSTSKARSHGGLGLGLAIVRHMVELHGGQVSARSDGLGKGATFDVRLPAAKQSGAPPNRASAPSPDVVAHLAGIHVLVVDDEPDARELLQLLLEPFGAVVTTAGSADEAIEHLQTNDYAAMISDLGMPHADGFELMRRVRGLAPRPRMRSIALSAYAAEKDKDDAMRAGFDAHVKKPIDTEELVDTLVVLVKDTPHYARRADMRERGNA